MERFSKPTALVGTGDDPVTEDSFRADHQFELFQWLATAFVVTIAEIAFFAGYVSVSYLLDAVAVAVFFGIRRARQQAG